MKKVIFKVLGSCFMFVCFMTGLCVVNESTVEICINPVLFTTCIVFFGVGVGIFNSEV